MSALWPADKSHEWCLNCGKPLFRCQCRTTLAAADRAPNIEPPRPPLREPPTSSNPADNGKGWRRKGRQYTGLRSL